YRSAFLSGNRSSQRSCVGRWQPNASPLIYIFTRLIEIIYSIFLLYLQAPVRAIPRSGLPH
ncbi:hypothetical protein JZU71_03525, partial [bacterium]|nr:hypothetical protein [bacterium]